MEENDILQKITYYLACFGISFSTLQLISVIIGIPGVFGIAIPFTIGSLVTKPLYDTLKKIREEQDKSYKNNLHILDRISLMTSRVNKENEKIDAMTATFIEKIIEYLKNHEIKLEMDSIVRIDSLLYLINGKYYDVIHNNLKSMNREMLVNEILNRIVNYVKINGTLFKHEDVKHLLDMCIFIPGDIRDLIYEEFSNSISNNKKGIYGIEREDVKDYIKQENFNNKFTYFDKNNDEHYGIIIQSVVNEEYFKQFGNAKLINWDITLLKEVTNIMIDLSQEIKDFEMVVSFINNLTCYAVINNRKSIGINEILNTFKAWDYFPVQLKMEIMNCLANKFNVGKKNESDLTNSKEERGIILEFPRKR